MAALLREIVIRPPAARMGIATGTELATALWYAALTPVAAQSAYRTAMGSSVAMTVVAVRASPDARVSTFALRIREYVSASLSAMVAYAAQINAAERALQASRVGNHAEQLMASVWTPRSRYLRNRCNLVLRFLSYPRLRHSRCPTLAVAS